MASRQLSIGQLALLSGCKVPTIRYYESIGLLGTPDRTDGRQRRFTTDSVNRLVFIRRSRELGFNLEEIRGLIDLAGDGNRSCAEVDAIARGHLAEIEDRLGSLTAMRDALKDVIDQCRRTTVLECRIIDALSPSSDLGADDADTSPAIPGSRANGRAGAVHEAAFVHPRKPARPEV